ncbi:16986_t:CDS:2 [Dentiscutata heterogama]|uniref:16986_t:CDS:1 n=1 Tax=Dentiscutata heterogama TaxID=1316150 RepID=A0ACA9KTZ2_9GLOM|nr:16986_t:CDS:2 [Dentiscutata heterogama]
MYIKDLELNQEDSLDIACDEAIFCRLKDYSNDQLKLNPILASKLGTKFLNKLQDVADYQATFCVLELVWSAVAIVIHIYMYKYGITLTDIENRNNNVLKSLKAFAPLFPAIEKNRYAESISRFLMTVEKNLALKAKLQVVGSINLIADEYFLAIDEALEYFGVKFIKQNITGCLTDPNNLKLVIKAVQDEKDRLMHLDDI